jgi:hypothetical protein
MIAKIPLMCLFFVFLGYFAASYHVIDETGCMVLYGRRGIGPVPTFLIGGVLLLGVWTLIRSWKDVLKKKDSRVRPLVFGRS